MKKKLIRLTESDLHKIVKTSVNRILKEINDYDEEEMNEEGYYWDIIDENNETVDDSVSDGGPGPFSTPDAAYQDGLESLKYWTDGVYKLIVWKYNQETEEGVDVEGYTAINNNGKIKFFNQ